MFGKLFDKAVGKAFEVAHSMKEIDRVYYGEVIKELENGYVVDEFWGEAIANSKGNKDKAESLYIDRRARSLAAFHSLYDPDSDVSEFLIDNRSRTYEK